jgi:aspartyl-tRNA(Asn)/glutamyl-tRNA(Gln) amidotransferase subunit B
VGEGLGETLPEMPEARFRRFVELGLPEYDAELLTSNKELADFFDGHWPITAIPKP